MPGITIVGMVCDSEGRHPEAKKVQKIVDWPAPRNVREARGFVGIAVYYRIFIANFSVLAALIFKLFKKNTRFRWTEDCQHAMNQLKSAITSAPTSSGLTSAPARYPSFLTSTLLQPLDGERFCHKSNLVLDDKIRAEECKTTNDFFDFLS